LISDTWIFNYILEVERLMKNNAAQFTEVMRSINMSANIGMILKKAATWYPDKEAVVYEDTRLTYRQLNERVNKLANGLLALGLKKGDFISIISSNRAEYAEMYFALPKMGAIIAPLNYRLTPDEIEVLISQCQSKAIILEPEFVDLINTLKPKLKSVKQYIVIGNNGKDYMVNYADLIAGSSITEPNVTVCSDDPTYVNYSSGTTGLPKASVMSHFNNLYGCMAKMTDQQVTQNDVFLCAFPLYGRIGLSNVAEPVMAGAKCVIITFTPAKFMETIEKERVTVTDIAPVMMNFLTMLPDLKKYNTSTLKAVYFIGSKLTQDTLEAAWNIFGDVIGEYYGTTETGPIVMASPGQKRKRPPSCGLPTTNTQVRIVDENGNDVKCGQPGEIITRNPGLNGNYVWDPESTSRFLKDGWFHTEDLGMLDEDGCLYVTGRIKDMIVSGAHNVFAPKVEEVIQSHPKILECAVIGVPHTVWGEAVLAVAVPKKGEDIAEAEIIEYSRTRLSNWECPKYVRFEENGLPRNPTAKILKRVLREKYAKIALE